ncbi:ABC transporter substrate-binding protein [uncultured Roseobacter sp.]|uniref:ABC transporter substrate-binding protein n=1 Tax=uncultured Roseobacter sp. TaxID=114847 RepID=UPI00262EE086|nr:ABC transporter substrate-binding protein [uncultured Roseobacter sp.]
MTHKGHIDRRALFASGAAAALLAATGVSAASLPERRGRFRVALSGGRRDDSFDPRLLGGHRQPDPSGLFLQVAMVGTLFETLTEVAADGTLRGELATAWRSNPDFTAWEFDLRTDVAFHNGAAFSANDVMPFSAYATPAGVLETVARVVPVDQHLVRFELNSPDPDLPFRLADPGLCVLPAGHMAEAMEQGIGTGPYKLRKFDPGRHLIADRLDRHHKDGRAAWFDTVELVGIDSDGVRAEALFTHMVDAADLTHAADLADTGDLTLLPREGFMSCAVDRCIGLPAQIGAQGPLDNLRAPQRWWMA